MKNNSKNINAHYKGKIGKWGKIPSANITDITFGRIADKFYVGISEGVSSIYSDKPNSKSMRNVKDIIKLYGYKYERLKKLVIIDDEEIPARIWQSKADNDLVNANLALEHIQDWAQEYCEVNEDIGYGLHFYPSIGRKRKPPKPLLDIMPPISASNSIPTEIPLTETERIQKSECLLLNQDLDKWYSTFLIAIESHINEFIEEPERYPFSFYVDHYNGLLSSLSKRRKYFDESRLKNLNCAIIKYYNTLAHHK